MSGGEASSSRVMTKKVRKGAGAKAWRETDEQIESKAESKRVNVVYDDDGFKVPQGPAPKRRKIMRKKDGDEAVASGSSSNDRKKKTKVKSPEEWIDRRNRKQTRFLEEARNKLLGLTYQDLEEGEQMADEIVEQIIANRKVGGAYAYFNIESMMAAVETRDNPNLRGYPIAVYHKGMVLSVNAAATRRGLKADVSVMWAWRLCTSLQLVPAHFSKYNKIVEDVKLIIKKYDRKAVASTSYAEVDLSHYLQKYNKTIEQLSMNTADQECIVRKIKRKIEAKTGLTVNVGVAPTPLVAKLASLVRRPGGVYFIPSSRESIDDFLHGIPVSQFCGIPAKVESMLQDLDIITSEQVFEHRGTLPHLVNDRIMLQLLCICLGCTPEFVGLGLVAEIQGVETVTQTRWLYGTRSLKLLKETCQDVCLSVEKKMKISKVVGKQIVLRVYTPKMEIRKKFCTLETPTNENYILMPTALRLLDLFLTEDKKLLIGGIRLDVSGLDTAPEPVASEPEEVVYGDDAEPGPSTRFHQGNAASEDDSTVKKANQNKSTKEKKSKKHFVLPCPVCSRVKISKRLQKAEERLDAHVDRCLRHRYAKMLAE